MKKSSILPAIGLALASTATPALAQHSAPADQAAIRSVIERTAAANNAGDVEAWVELFESDAVYMPQDAPEAAGHAELVEVARAGFANAADIRIEPREIVVSGDWAFARNSVTGQVTLRDGHRVIPIDTKQLVVYHRQADGSWRIARMISNRNPT